MIAIIMLPFDSIHVNPFGLSSHRPFSEQVAELAPISTDPGGQLSLTVLPSIGKLS